ncbi:hypothetical protein UA08_06036 [Talaromyces atroroseus]|uniref:Cation/H+ exchanger transmembrane domain-containing protein n=1 Tax=Talaromyces atroroseus TaxID=1441469 RepID=A0A225AGZ4_TALAT|nr:hypothetical protein UA08_06036 [Talaromyces atroroseus]OKL58483.1 hypothetical protein UA08_06036 [Talaromyces atroroseus]
MSTETAFPYQEPTISTILNQAGLLLALNIVNACLDKLLYCGLIGQLFIGILWGTPGAKWIGGEMEKVIQQLGYLGLIMLVYEAVALTGILTPIALSFILKELVAATSLQAFAAGAALSATSLGTTFTVLSTTQLIATRLGTVTTCAAMLDDVVGLVMVQVISNLGGNDDASISAVTIIRPVIVSIGFAAGIFLLCSFCLKPVIRIGLASGQKMPEFIRTTQFAFCVHAIVLFGMVAGASYAGTSSLFAAYLGGVIISWFDELAAGSKDRDFITSQSVSTQHQEAGAHTGNQQSEENTSSNALPATQENTTRDRIPTGDMIYETYYRGPVNRILIPLFFASIGFAIPITEMFHGNVVWRGIVYALLMALGKIVTGIWLVRVSASPVAGFMAVFKKAFSYATSFMPVKFCKDSKRKKGIDTSEKKKKESRSHEGPTRSNNDTTSASQPSLRARPDDVVAQTEPSSLLPKPKSLYPPSILGLAMIARGEVGYLIASLAQSQGIFDNDSNGSSSGSGSSDIYLVIIWAISICTLIGPIAVGFLVRRVKRLQEARGDTGTGDPLGVWGI